VNTPVRLLLAAAAIGVLGASPVRADGDSPCPYPIRIILIDKATIDALGPLPWSRERFAKLVRIVDSGGARAVALAFHFRDPGPGKGDDALAAAMKKSGHVFISTGSTEAAASWEPDGTWWGRMALNAEGVPPKKIIEGKYITLPVKKLADAAAGIGATDRMVDKNKQLGSLPLMIKRGNWFIPSLGFRLFLHLKGLKNVPLAFKKGKQIIIERTKINLDSYGSALVNITPPGSAYPTHGFSAVLKGKVAPASFKNAVVLISMQDPNTDIATTTGPKNSLELVADQLVTLYGYMKEGGGK